MSSSSVVPPRQAQRRMSPWLIKCACKSLLTAQCVVQGIIPVEGLLLEEVPPGLHQLHCLPLKVVGSDGAPVRCIITVS